MKQSLGIAAVNRRINFALTASARERAQGVCVRKQIETDWSSMQPDERTLPFVRLPFVTKNNPGPVGL